MAWLCLLAAITLSVNSNIPKQTGMVYQNRMQIEQKNGTVISTNPLTIQNIEYCKVGKNSLLLDLYLPLETSKSVPLVMWIHGGGWMDGSREKAQCRLMEIGLLDHGYAIASIDYRSTREVPFPAQIQDCKTALNWLRTYARKYNIDRNRIGVAGASAGGHLAALMGTTSGVKEFDGKYRNCKVKVVCDFYGPTDLVELVREMATDSKYDATRAELEICVKYLLAGPPLENPEKAKTTNPITYITKDDPPFLILHGDDDRHVPASQSLLLEKALKKSGVEVELIVIKGAIHGGAEFTEKQRAARILKFFDEKLKK